MEFRCLNAGRFLQEHLQICWHHPWLQDRGEECQYWLWETVEERTKTKRGQGRESPECKVMSIRNVWPPVFSCNLTGSSPNNCPSLRQSQRVGGNERGLVREGFLVEDEKDCTSNHWSYFLMFYSLKTVSLKRLESMMTCAALVCIFQLLKTSPKSYSGNIYFSTPE